MIEHELGQQFYGIDYVKDKNQEVVIYDGLLDINRVGKYVIEYHLNSKVELAIVCVKDTTSPIFKTHKKTYTLGSQIQPDDFVSDVIDCSVTTTIIKKIKQIKEVGTHLIEVCVSDIYKNKTCQKEEIVIQAIDTTPPTIEQLETIITGLNIKPDYNKGVIISDDIDEHPIFEYNDTNVDYTQIGSYIVVYKAIDFQGNEAFFERVVKVQDYSKTIYLTFDDGPSINTQTVLEILNRYNIKATFFVTGVNPKYYNWIESAYLQGHTIGLHTFSHNYKELYSSLSNYQKDLDQIAQVVKCQIGFIPTFIRFPGGTSNTISATIKPGVMKQIVSYINQSQYQYIDWNASNGDGTTHQTVEKLIEEAKVSVKGKKQVVLLMHDGSGNKMTVEALPSIIEYYISQGYQFSAIDEKTPKIQHKLQQ